jgi:hypothetical protein
MVTANRRATFVNVSDVARANLQAAQTRGVLGSFQRRSGEAITVNSNSSN